MPKRLFIKDGGLTASITVPTGYTVIGSENGNFKKQVTSTISDLSSKNWVKIATLTKDDLNGVSGTNLVFLYENSIPSGYLIGDCLVKVNATFSATLSIIDTIDVKGLSIESIGGTPYENLANIALGDVIINSSFNQVTGYNMGGAVSNSDFITGLRIFIKCIPNYQDFTQGSLDVYLELNSQI